MISQEQQNLSIQSQDSVDLTSLSQQVETISKPRRRGRKPILATEPFLRLGVDWIEAGLKNAEVIKRWEAAGYEFPCPRTLQSYAAAIRAALPQRSREQSIRPCGSPKVKPRDLDIREFVRNLKLQQPNGPYALQFTPRQGEAPNSMSQTDFVPAMPETVWHQQELAGEPSQSMNAEAGTIQADHLPWVHEEGHNFSCEVNNGVRPAPSMMSIPGYSLTQLEYAPNDQSSWDNFSVEPWNTVQNISSASSAMHWSGSSQPHSQASSEYNNHYASVSPYSLPSNSPIDAPTNAETSPWDLPNAMSAGDYFENNSGETIYDEPTAYVNYQGHVTSPDMSINDNSLSHSTGVYGADVNPNFPPPNFFSSPLVHRPAGTFEQHSDEPTSSFGDPNENSIGTNQSPSVDRKGKGHQRSHSDGSRLPILGQGTQLTASVTAPSTALVAPPIVIHSCETISVQRPTFRNEVPTLLGDPSVAGGELRRAISAPARGRYFAAPRFRGANPSASRKSDVNRTLMQAYDSNVIMPPF